MGMGGGGVQYFREDLGPQHPKNPFVLPVKAYMRESTSCPHTVVELVWQKRRSLYTFKSMWVGVDNTHKDRGGR